MPTALRRPRLASRPVPGLLCGLVALAAAGVVGVVVQAEDDPAAVAYRDAYKLILEEKWPEATKAMEAVATAHGKSAWADDAQFWLCYGREKQGGDSLESLEASLRCYQALVRERPSSDWADDGKRALARLAGALAERGRPQHRDELRELGASSDEDLFPVLMALAEIGDDRAVATIVDKLAKTEDERTRARIVRVLGRIDSPAAAEALREILERDPSTDVRAAALRAIAEQDGPEAVRFLGAVAADTKQPAELRAAALRGLGEQDDPAVVGLLASVARGHDPDLATAAIRALGEVGDEAVPALRELAEGGDPSRRRDAARALGEIGTPEARDALIELLGDGR